MSRSLNRSGFGNNRGALNVPIHVGTTAPTNPVFHHLWLDISGATGVWKYWNGSIWKT
jgi:hypothetical protein